jgi:DNA-binding MarR family transcriptional regulator
MLADRDFAALSRFRTALAHFLRFSERAARAAGTTPAQYLLLLHLRGSPGGCATVGELARRLEASAHGTTALISRSLKAGLVSKRRDSIDARRVEVHLTPRGRRRVEQIAARHREELVSLRAVFKVAHVT